ncbi:conserved hypothetical protein [uncultured Mycobacterium sp.]|uniref:Uncharacterized protein n=1 Tax=uncultured Mycobacterium sp. TaxID=171292 RepID=A0A1Y5PCZ3_9MYCO|nr:conserved hypothetical protein [uncultured Mycobacterium sp.]
MSETTDETTTLDTEGDIPDATPDASEGTTTSEDVVATEDSETFPRQVVEDLRQENGRYRQRAQRADDLAQRLHTEMVKATGRLADPTDLAFDETHLDDPDALTAAVDDLLARKPHLATRKPTGDIGQGHRGGASQPVSLLQILKDVT